LIIVLCLNGKQQRGGAQAKIAVAAWPLSDGVVASGFVLRQLVVGKMFFQRCSRNSGEKTGFMPEKSGKYKQHTGCWMYTVATLESTGSKSNGHFGPSIVI
jgi:hypothetical protein